jgi:peptide/nickel transport system permease protein
VRGWAASLRLGRSAWAGVGLLGLFVVVALVGPLLAPCSPTQQDLDHLLAGPSAAHWLGTDENGVDLLSEMLHGARMALFISSMVMLICAALGTAIGVLAGYYRGWVEELVMRVVDVLLAFPGILLNIAIVALVARPGIGVLVFALCLNGWVGYARLARGQVLSLRERDYVLAARAMGARPARIMWRHIVPNLLSPLLVQMSFAFGGIVLVEASLSFLGLGPQLSYTWGALLDQGTTYLWKTQRLALVPGIAIMVVVLGSNLLGDGLRDRLDPRRRGVG